VEILRRGGLVAFPTETVYGLGADASNPAAIARIYSAKGRPAGHPVIVHLGHPGQVEHWARDVPDNAKRLIERFWPGPLTLVLRRASGVGNYLTGGQDTIGLRMPSHPVALELLREFAGTEAERRRVGVAAPSANKFGRISPTTAEHVRNDFGDEVDLVLDGGSCEVGIESTILDLSRGRAVLLRPGRVSIDQLTAALGSAPAAPDARAPRAPGTLESHYAPHQPLRLVAPDRWGQTLQKASPRRAVLALSPRPTRDASVLWIDAPRQSQDYARDLYANLRALDVSGCDEILVEAPPATAEWIAVRDRLDRARSG
jgi:L-threonylcarbamoyladenylate synthase